MSVSSLFFSFTEDQLHRIAFGQPAKGTRNCCPLIERTIGLALLVFGIGSFIVGSLVWCVEQTYSLCNRCCYPPRDGAERQTIPITHTATQILGIANSGTSVSLPVAAAPVRSVSPVVSPLSSVAEYRELAKSINIAGPEKFLASPSNGVDSSAHDWQKQIQEYAQKHGRNLQYFNWNPPTYRQIPSAISLFTELLTISARNIHTIPDLSPCSKLATLNITSDDLQFLPGLTSLISLENLILRKPLSGAGNIPLPKEVMQPAIDWLESRLRERKPCNLDLLGQTISDVHRKKIALLSATHKYGTVIITLPEGIIS